MEIGELIEKDISFEIDGASFVFAPSSHQDILYAMNLLEYLKGEGAKETAMGKDAAIKHAFSKLKTCSGVLSGGKELQAEDLKSICLRAQSKSIIPIVTAWAVRVVKDHGFIEVPEEKKETASV